MSKKRRNAIPLLTAILLLASTSAFCDTITVTTTSDQGTGSLRSAIQEANNNFGYDTIEFAVSGTISVGTSTGEKLPAIEDDYTIINASSQWVGTWPEGSPGVIIDGSFFEQ